MSVIFVIENRFFDCIIIIHFAMVTVPNLLGGVVLNIGSLTIAGSMTEHIVKNNNQDIFLQNFYVSNLAQNNSVCAYVLNLDCNYDLAE